jgi:N-formylglutamate deformylase
LGIAQSIPGHSAVLNGRFKGGHITRHYGRPAEGIQAVQLELTQCSYMNESGGFEYEPERAERVQSHLRRMLSAMFAHARRQVKR